jgi:hypothetical protein
VLVLAGLGLVLGIYGQTGTGNEIEFKVSSPFIAGSAKFPAGTYTIRQDADDQLEWEISNDAKGFSAFLPTKALSTTSPNQKTEVTFEKYGNTLVLKEIWIPGLSNGYSVEASYAEKKAAKAGSPTKVPIAAQKK